MTSSTKQVAQLLEWPAACHETALAKTLSAGAPVLFPPLLGLVQKYLFPEPEEWIVEWTGEYGRELLTRAIVRVEHSLPSCLVDLIASYLKKSDIYGLEAQRRTYSQETLVKALGRVAMERPLPCDIDADMQTDLAQLFDPKALKNFKNLTKATELFSLYYRMSGVTLRVSEKLAESVGLRFHPLSLPMPEIRPIESEGVWIQYSNSVIGRQKSFLKKQALVPVGFEIPSCSIAIFCAFTKHACSSFTKDASLPPTFSLCVEQVYGYHLGVGDVHNDQILIGSLFGNDAGVAVIRKF